MLQYVWHSLFFNAGLNLLGYLIHFKKISFAGIFFLHQIENSTCEDCGTDTTKRDNLVIGKFAVETLCSAKGLNLATVSQVEVSLIFFIFHKNPANLGISAFLW